LIQNSQLDPPTLHKTITFTSVPCTFVTCPRFWGENYTTGKPHRPRNCFRTGGDGSTACEPFPCNHPLMPSTWTGPKLSAFKFSVWPYRVWTQLTGFSGARSWFTASWYHATLRTKSYWLSCVRAELQFVASFRTDAIYETLDTSGRIKVVWGPWV